MTTVERLACMIFCERTERFSSAVASQQLFARPSVYMYNNNNNDIGLYKIENYYRTCRSADRESIIFSFSDVVVDVTAVAAASESS